METPALLYEYKYEIEYKKGVLNTNADALSRVGEVMVEKIVVDKTTGLSGSEDDKPSVRTIRKTERKVNLVETEKHFKLPDSVLPKDIIDAQKEDVYTKRIIENTKRIIVLTSYMRAFYTLREI